MSAISEFNTASEGFNKAAKNLANDYQKMEDILHALVNGLDNTCWSSWQSTAKFYDQLQAAHNFLEKNPPKKYGRRFVHVEGFSGGIKFMEYDESTKTCIDHFEDGHTSPAGSCYTLEFCEKCGGNSNGLPMLCMRSPT